MEEGEEEKDARAAGVWIAGIINGLIDGFALQGPKTSPQSKGWTSAPQEDPYCCTPGLDMLMRRIRKEILTPVAEKMYSDAYPLVIGMFAAAVVNLLLCITILALLASRSFGSRRW